MASTSNKTDLSLTLIAAPELPAETSQNGRMIAIAPDFRKYETLARNYFFNGGSLEAVGKAYANKIKALIENLGQNPQPAKIQEARALQSNAKKVFQIYKRVKREYYAYTFIGRLTKFFGLENAIDRFNAIYKEANASLNKHLPKKAIRISNQTHVKFIPSPKEPDYDIKPTDDEVGELVDRPVQMPTKIAAADKFQPQMDKLTRDDRLARLAAAHQNYDKKYGASAPQEWVDDLSESFLQDTVVEESAASANTNRYSCGQFTAGLLGVFTLCGHAIKACFSCGRKPSETAPEL